MDKTLPAWALWIIIIIVLLAGAYLLGRDTAVAPTTAPAPPSWEVEALGEDAATGTPMTRVYLVLDGERRDLGAHQGSCFEIANSSWTLLADEESGVICWYAGGGVEFGLFRENDTLVLKQGVLDEGTAEEAGVRGNFSTIIFF